MTCTIEQRVNWSHLARVLAARADRDRYREWNDYERKGEGYGQTD